AWLMAPPPARLPLLCQQRPEASASAVSASSTRLLLVGPRGASWPPPPSQLDAGVSGPIHSCRASGPFFPGVQRGAGFIDASHAAVPVLAGHAPVSRPVEVADARRSS